MLHQAFGDNTMSQRKTLLWYKRFKDGWTSVDDDERSGRPSTSTTPENIAKVREAILADHRQTIHDVCEIAGLTYGTVQRILADNLNMSRISARVVPRLLSDDQKAHPVSVCRELKQQARDDPIFISNITTGDKTWVYGYDTETKQQSLQWKSPNSPRPKKKSASSSQQYQVHVHRFFPTSKASSIRNSYPLVKPSMASFTVRFWSGRGRAFGADVQTSGRTTIGFSTMPTRPLTHRSLFDNSWLPKTLLIPPSPHSPDLVPCAFFLFPKMKLRLSVVLTRVRSTQNRKRISTHSHFRSSRDARNHGKHAGIVVYMPNGTTSKETVETRSYGKKLFYGQIPRVFG